MATHWEYKLEPPSPDVGTLAEMLRDEDAEGWELGKSKLTTRGGWSFAASYRIRPGTSKET